MNKTSFSNFLKNETFLQLCRFYKGYLRNPVVEISPVPDWSWKILIISSSGAAALSGVLSGILAKSFFNVIAGLIFSPVGGLILLFIFTLVFYYFFLFVLQREISFRQIYTIIYLASLPAQLLFILSPIAPIIQVPAALVAAFLLIVGFVRNFDLSRKPVFYFVGALFIISQLIWLSNSHLGRKNKRQLEQLTTPESLDILEKEIQGN